MAPANFLVARNPDPASQLPYLIRLPVGGEWLVLKAREPWPRTSKVYCHRADEWPDDPDIVEEVNLRSCVRRGPAIDVVLDRARENRSQLVFTRLKGGREGIFWQSARTTKQARPGVRVPTRRATGWHDLPLLIDTRERYPYRFSRLQVNTQRRALPAGDYAVEHEGAIVAAVERKSVADLAGVMVDGSMSFLLADLSSVFRAAVVVEGRYAELYRLPHVAPGFLPDLVARLQARYPSVPIVFCDTRPLAEQWTYRFLAAALSEAIAGDGTDGPPVRDNRDDGESAGWSRSGAYRAEEGRGSLGQGAG